MIDPADLRLSRSGGRAVAKLSGDIDLSNAAIIKRSIAESVSNDATELVVDLTETRYLDSAGIAMLFDLSRRMRDHDQRMVVVVPSASLIHRSLAAGGWPPSVALVETLDELEQTTP